MGQYINITKTAIKNLGKRKITNSILDGDIIFTGYREYDQYCECDIIFTGRIYEGYGPYMQGRWLDTEKITKERFSINKVTRSIRESSYYKILEDIRSLGINLPVKIKKVKLI